MIFFMSKKNWILCTNRVSIESRIDPIFEISWAGWLMAIVTGFLSDSLPLRSFENRRRSMSRINQIIDSFDYLPGMVYYVRVQ
jgi:hypothetical protein